MQSPFKVIDKLLCHQKLLVRFLIATINLALTLLFVVLPNRLLLVHGYPLGCLPPLLWCVFYGVTLGTNSFTIPLPVRLAPSVAVLGRSGLYEIAAYCLAATSTHAIARTRSRAPRYDTVETINDRYQHSA